MTEASPEAWGVVITAIAALDYLNRLTNAEIEALNQPRLGAADRRKTGVVQVSLRVRELFGNGMRAPHQPSYPATGFAQVRLVSEAMRSVICISLFQASQHASRMAS